MWMIVMFDLPTKDKASRKKYQQFRNLLLDEGFNMLQYSVYGRHCATREKVENKKQRLTRNLPPKGEVRILQVTEAQFSKMTIYRQNARATPETPAPQLELWG